jgi:aerobic C4-dicarboxylate transport protein
MTQEIDIPDSELVELANKPPWWRSLFAQLILAIVLGVVIGWLWPKVGHDLKPLADGFIKLIRMVIAPIIFCTVVLGIAHVGDMRAVGRIGGKALLYFEVVTTFALFFGVLVANVLRPGSGFHIDPGTLAHGSDAVAKSTGGGSLPHTADFLLDIIPSSIFDAFAKNSMLQILFFAVLFGLALAKFGHKAPPVILTLVDQTSHVMFTMVGWIMRVAPLGAFGAMGYIIGQYGIKSLGSFAKLIGCCYLAAVLFIVILAVIARVFAGLSLWRFLIYIKDELFLALGTASTEVVLPRIMTKLTVSGCSRATTGLVVPTGYSFNLDGATMYLSICVLFLAQALGVHLSLGEQLAAILVLMLTSKGMAGVPGSSFLALSATVAAIAHGAIPVAAVALLLGVDRIMDSMRVTVNLLGNCVATFVVANWEGQLDPERRDAMMAGNPIPLDEDQDEMTGADPAVASEVVRA